MQADEPLEGAQHSIKLPPMLIGMALLFWGWQQRELGFAIPLAIVIEAARWIPWRWRFTDEEFNRVADLSALIFVLTIVYAFDSHSFLGIYMLLKWLPVNLFLLVGAQLYSTRGEIRYTALFLSIRRAVARGTHTENRGLDFRLPYLAAVLLAVTGGVVRGPGVFAGLIVAIMWLLWANRPRRWSVRVWFIVMALATGFAYLNQQGLIQLRRAMEPYVLEWFHDRMWNYRDPYQTYTAMGQIGRLKLSDRIVLRVTPQNLRPVPPLLREASYQTFSKNIWLAGDSSFDALKPDIEGTHWELKAGIEPAQQIRITRSMPRGKGLLPVPNGTFSIDNLPVEDLHRNPLGALKVINGPGLISYTASFDSKKSFDAPPDDADLVIPVDLRQVIQTVADDLQLSRGSASQVVERLDDYFLSGFEYTVTLRKPTRAGSPLQDFLLRSHRGHFEFFASASVLLLRQAGIPARYATGYSVQEFSQFEQRYLVRRRHAHSWALAYLDGRWQDVDTTPPVWGELEAASAPWWTKVYDPLSWLRFRYDSWRWDAEEDDSGFEVIWLAIPLLLVLLWRLYLSERVAFGRKVVDQGLRTVERPGDDSELYRIERYFGSKGFERRLDEPFSAFFGRLRSSRAVPGCDEILEQLLPAHYQYRFDPLGLSDQQRERLRDLVQAWLKRYAVG